MEPFRALYRRLPITMKLHVDRLYGTLQRRRTSTADRERFLTRFFRDGEYERYATEFEDAGIEARRNRMLEAFERSDPAGGLFGDVRPAVGRDLYALVRSQEPDRVVETGVCNGFSSLCILAALDENGRGTLSSIDYPYRTGESLADFREETFEGYGGAAVPGGKDPGWLVPEGLAGRWSLMIGKSQRELPRLLADVDDIDLFLHDSEHSLPCMYFEFELAWEWLRPGGVLVADDVGWNDAFETFVAVRGGEGGRLQANVGYTVK